MENIINIIGNNIGKIRKENGYSFDQLAQLTGVSKSMLAQIEKGQKTPTVTTLWKIASGLNVTPSLLMVKTQQATVQIVKTDNLTRLIEDDGKYIISPFLPFDNETKFEVYKMELEPGCIHISDPHFKDVKEYVFVYTGTIEIEIEDKVYKASSGEAIVFSGDVHHTYKNIGKETVSVFNLIFNPNR
ncbi:helix-turn-helix domain-containing protein [Oceanobacillus sp. 143]|uniref:DNA-binding protein n=1 Tax=Oceanobacillus zhaokaii TaxID=2052660 RepID=A0A345PK78_9BACI|nr:XRE family transcriptional regulator [Oceanobacillus zhaokaii]AXI10408.1 DNA-binding protein [Oceanobacillus zhaokaii]QGS69429.1 helix-turn-helix domain-containing protein [Oceanobacillus sp. 143]